MKRIVKDYIENKNNDNIMIRIARKYTRDENDPLTHTIWEGLLHDVPKDLQKLEVISEGWMVEAQLNQLEVFISEGDLDA